MTTSEIGLDPESVNELRIHDYESDHRAVEITLNMGEFRLGEPSLMFDFNRTDTKRLNTILSQALLGCALPTDRNITTMEINQSTMTMTEIFNTTIDEVIPKISTANRGLLKLSPNILLYIAEKKCLRRILFGMGTSILKAAIRNLDRVIQGAIALYERNHCTENPEENQDCSHDVPKGCLINDEVGKANFLAILFGAAHL